MSIIEVNQVGKWVDSGREHLEILKQVTFSIESGESVAILGASGSGKSTLLGLMAGLDTSSQGKIHLGGHDLSSLSHDQRAAVRAEMVGFVFQNFYLVPGLSALENVMLPLEINSGSMIEKRAREYLVKVGLEHRLHHLPAQLSGGEQQRVALARAFVTEPAILFADEPTGNLDQHTGQQIIELLFHLNQQTNTTLVLVTHDTSLAAQCNRRLVLDEGELTEYIQPVKGVVHE